MSDKDLNYWSEATHHRLTRRQALRGAALGAGGLAAAALIGCGDDEDGGGDATSTAEATASGTAAGTATATEAAGTPRFGGRLVTSDTADPPGFSVLRAANTTHRANSLTMDKLLEFDSGPGKDAYNTELIPGLAEALPEQPDDLTYVFKIRQGVKFQNVDPVNGRDMTIEDVLESIETLRGPGSDFETYWDAVESIEATDDSTMVVKTTEPYAPLLLSITGHYGWYVFPRELMENDLTDRTAIGTGAYTVAEWEQGNRIVYQKNPDYWNNDRIAPGGPGYVDEIEWLIIPTPDSNVAAFSTGQMDLLRVAVPPELEERITGDFTQQSWRGSAAFSGIDTSQPPFDDVRVREAIWRLYDREGEKAAIWGGDSEPGTLLTQARALTPQEVHGDLLIRDVDEAKKLLSAAGFPDGFETDIAWTTGYASTHATSLEYFIGSVQEAGITLNPRSYEYGQWIAEIYRPPFNWVGMTWGATRAYPEPDQEARYWLYPGGNTNQSRVDNPDLNALIDEQAVTLDPDARWEILHDIQRFEAENRYYLWKNNTPTKNFFKDRVHDWQGHAHYTGHNFWYVWVDA